MRVNGVCIEVLTERYSSERKAQLMECSVQADEFPGSECSTNSDSEVSCYVPSSEVILALITVGLHCNFIGTSDETFHGFFSAQQASFSANICDILIPTYVSISWLQER